MDKLKNFQILITLPIIMDKALEECDIPDEVKRIKLSCIRNLSSHIESPADIDFEVLKKIYTKNVLDKMFIQFDSSLDEDLNPAHKLLRDQFINSIDKMEESIITQFDVLLKFGSEMYDKIKANGGYNE